MKHLYFCRHGKSTANVFNQYAGHTDTPLIDQGREEALAVSASVGKLDIDVIVSSPLIRALETAQIVAENIDYPKDKIITSNLFKEHDVGMLAGRSCDDYDEFDSSFAGMESKKDFEARIKKGLDFLRQIPDDNVLLVSHGALFIQLIDILGIAHKHPKEINKNDANELANAKIEKLI